MPSLRIRFDAKWMPVTESGCWLWLGAVSKDGYGSIGTGDDTETMPAHRAAYELYRGPIPNGLQIDHLCRVRCCVNPWHMEPVTQQENIRRGNGGKWRREKTHCPQGHAYSDENLSTYRPKHLLPHHSYRACKICMRLKMRRRRQLNG